MPPKRATRKGKGKLVVRPRRSAEGRVPAEPPRFSVRNPRNPYVYQTNIPSRSNAHMRRTRRELTSLHRGEPIAA